ncbi:NEDD8-activating enzyme E1 catalytic subunit [Dictyocoela muelleri]|nr:NEDD8-activating enzyme E1 catalytic subunit [Dictyocoela muelleri]
MNSHKIDGNNNILKNFVDKDESKNESLGISDYSKNNVFAYFMRVQDIDKKFLSKFDIVFVALDNIEGRMHMNYLCKLYKILMIDGGVENFECHVKCVTDESCLYCIKSLYTNQQKGYCTLKDERIRLIHQLSESMSNEEIVVEFNRMKIYGNTDMKEVESVLNNVLPNICTINSICAALMIICWKKKLNFLYFNGKALNFTFVDIKKDEDCILCNDCE